MAVVYLHKRNDTNEVFYVGIGKEDKRAFRKDNRTQYWKNIVKKYGYTVDILVSDTSWEDACKIEKLLIEKYGRKDLALGSLVNMTDGGEGVLGLRRTHSEKAKNKIGEASKGRTHSEETRKKISEWQKGRTHSEETRQKMTKPKSQEHKQKMTKPKSQEHKQKLIISHRNREGVKGYYFNKKANKYQAYIMVGGKSIHLGLHNTPEEAELAYKQGKLKYHI